MKKLLPILILVALAAACTDTQETDQQLSWGQATLSIENPIAPQETLSYHIDFKLDTLAGQSTLAESVSAVIRDSILRAFATSTVQEAMAASADSIQKDWQESLAEMYDPMSDFRECLQYSYDLQGTPTENGRDSILTYQVTLSCYLGGAHGSYVINYYNFNKKDGRLLGIRDFVPAEKEQEVLQEMLRQLCKEYEAKDIDELREKTGILMLGDLYLTDNFMPKGDSLSFLFNQYDIAPYAAGLIGITIPLQPSR